jgi:hypothetical protein
MKTQVDIITGFLDSGKTSFINERLADKTLSNEKTVIIQFETGEVEIDNRLTKDQNIFINEPKIGQPADAEYLKEILSSYSPNRIIIEYNGVARLDELFRAFEDRELRKKCYINTIVNTIDASTFDLYMKNMVYILIDQIISSDLIIINRAEEIPPDELDRIRKKLKSLNKKAEIITKRADFASKSNQVNNASRATRYADLFSYLFIGLVIIYLFLNLFSATDFSFDINLSWMQVLNTVFLSILMQAFPFILIGVLVSSIIQVYISSETIVKLFPRKMGMGYIAAMFAGVFIPVCDCGIIPVAARLIKKGVPLATAVTFMLSAPIVNPIVIISTLYAFPGQPAIALYRVFFGLAVALAVGLSLFYYSYSKSLLLGDLDNLSCNCGYCNEETLSKAGFGNKLSSIFKHAGSEFFEVGKFLIMGAFLSSLVQTTVPKDIFNLLGDNSAISLMVMMATAFVLSVCSTSDAFIARTFLSQFSLGSVMGFLVLGPMIDIKNLLMLLSSFKRSFVIRLVAIILGWAFIILYFLNPLL